MCCPWGSRACYVGWKLPELIRAWISSPVKWEAGRPVSPMVISTNLGVLWNVSASHTTHTNVLSGEIWGTLALDNLRRTFQRCAGDCDSLWELLHLFIHFLYIRECRAEARHHAGGWRDRAMKTQVSSSKYSNSSAVLQVKSVWVNKANLTNDN